MSGAKKGNTYMSIQQIQTLRDAAIVPLSTKGWEDARSRAEAVIAGRISAPLRHQFRAADSQYPPQLIGVVVALMIAVALAAFYISAGKEIAVVDTVMRGLVVDYARLTVAYIEIAILAALMLSEFGALLFGLGSRVLATHRALSRVMRFFQIICVLIAILGNITITMAHPIVEALVFDWFLTLAAPVLVIGIGLIVEELLSTWLIARQSAISKYNDALKAWQQATADPESHPDFYAVWGEEILDQLNQRSPRNKKVIAELLEGDPGLRIVIVSLEWARHDWLFTANVAAEISGKLAGNSGNSSNSGQSPQPQSAVSTISAVSGNSGQLPAISVQKSITRQEALELFEADPTLMSLSGAELVARYGGTASTYSKARGDYRTKHAPPAATNPGVTP
jgi:hypothetical protein